MERNPAQQSGHRSYSRVDRFSFIVCVESLGESMAWKPEFVRYSLYSSIFFWMMLLKDSGQLPAAELVQSCFSQFATQYHSVAQVASLPRASSQAVPSTTDAQAAPSEGCRDLCQRAGDWGRGWGVGGRHKRGTEQL